ncbi:MAG: DUF2905 domain-containing protein [Acidobacteria bacterium]|nr:MAG: DUF2905 domain-containing protein [Acidobacteriota bacterium]PYQ22989.1 MAG: DUF2905 domain-containing protein [Acidobacteriota bacterium]
MGTGSPSDVGRLLVAAGGLLAALGLVLMLAGKIPFLGRLPGDIVYRKGGSTFYFPLVTCLLLSLLLTVVLRLLRR